MFTGWNVIDVTIQSLFLRRPVPLLPLGWAEQDKNDGIGR